MSTEKGFERQLVADGVVDDERLTRAKSEATRTGTSLIHALTQLGYATSEAVYRSLAASCALRFVIPSKMEISEEIGATVPARFANHYNFVPVQERNGTLVIAFADPLNVHLVDDIRGALKRRIEVAVTTPEEIQRTQKALYGVGADTVERILSDSDSVASVLSLDSGAGTSNLGDENIDASIVKFVNELLAEAVRTSATDIHMEPFEDQLRVRYRIDGILHQVPVPPTIRGLHPAIISRIKIMANLNIAEKRLPQDGKILASLGDQKFDLRISILPTPHGETVSIRILNRSSMYLSLEHLGYRSEDLNLFSAYLTKPHGMILVTGPTGSGKTTTLYAALSKLNKLDHKIITIEDPIEYQLKGVTQMQVHDQIGFNFASALRSMLRHDPDIMLVGEIRDQETAEMAIRSSLTGHLVFSTLHTNDAAGAVTRLTDMSIEPFLIASTMLVSIAQRLLRTVCPLCAEPMEPGPELLEELRLCGIEPSGAQFKHGKGCDSCRYTGYKGRMAIYEILPFTNAIKELTVQRAPSMLIKRKAREQGMKTLRECGLTRVLEGKTTFEEILRVTADSDAEIGVPVETHAAV